MNLQITEFGAEILHDVCLYSFCVHTGPCKSPALACPASCSPCNRLLSSTMQVQMDKVVGILGQKHAPVAPGGVGLALGRVQSAPSAHTHLEEDRCALGDLQILTLLRGAAPALATLELRARMEGRLAPALPSMMMQALGK